MKRPVGLLYAVDERPPPVTLVLAALQQVAVMSNSLVYPVIIAREIGLAPEMVLGFVSRSMFILGVATIVLCMRSRFVGSGYLCPAGFTQIYLGPSLLAMQRGGFALAAGMTIISGLIQCVMAPLLRRLRIILPPEIAGLVIAVVGLSIAVIGVRYSLGIGSAHHIHSTDLAIAILSLVIMSVLNIWSRGFAKMFCVLIGMATGYALAGALGMLDFSATRPPGGVAFMSLPAVSFAGLSFDADLLAPFVVVALAGTLHLMGNISTAQRINDEDWVRPEFRSLSGGIAGNGIAAVLCGLIGTMGVNSYSSSIGVSTATGITSRTVAYLIGALFVLLSLFPAASIVVATIPAPVVGAALFFTAAFVFVSGLQMITARLLDSRKIIVIGFSFAMAMMSDIYHDVFTAVPAPLEPVLGNALVLGTACAVLLNLITRLGVRKRALLRFEEGAIDREALARFLAEQGGHWAARRDVIERATFGAVQLVEMLGQPGGPVEFEAGFDEFNLDLRLRYRGVPLAFPPARPTRREILEDPEGERLLAGHLLRRSADRIAVRASGEEAEVLLHYDH
jgi:xanthine permease XanP